MAPASILLLEDDADMRAMLTELLLDEGYPVRACATLDDVRRAGRDGDATLALLGAWGDGRATLSEDERRELRDLASTVPTIVVTEGRWGETVPAAELGLLGVVRKPFDVDELAALVKSSIDRLLRDCEAARADARRLRSEVQDARNAMTHASQRLDALTERVGRATGKPGHDHLSDAAPSGVDARRLLRALQRLLALEATDVHTALTQAAQQIADVLHADKVDVFVYRQDEALLEALGTSVTPMGVRQHELGLHRQPLADGGTSVRVFQSGRSVLIRDTHVQGGELRGIVDGLDVRSQVAAPIVIHDERRGVLLACSATPGRFGEDDLAFLEAVARWVGLVGYRAALVERTVAQAVQESHRVAVVNVVGRLTPRQREVSRLVARGLSNAQIAAELVITEGTVANHVEQILRRLNYRSRAQIAALFGAHEP